jgi:hypothetical protein
MDASGYRMADAFYKSLGTPPGFSPLTIDGTAKVLVASLVGGFPGLNPKADYEDTPPAVVSPLGERRSGWWVISQLMKRLGMPVPDHVPDDDRRPRADEDMLARLMTEGARCTFEEVEASGWVEKPLEFPARWVDAHVERMGGWKIAPPML